MEAKTNREIIWWRPVEGLEINEEKAIGLITGKIEPTSTLEDNFVQDNANTVLPEVKGSNNRRRFDSVVDVFVPPTFVAKVSEALDKKRDEGTQ